MKFSLALALLYSVSVEAFLPSSAPVPSATALKAVVDTQSAVRQALDFSKKFGVTSPEARVAWDAVEEMRASDNSAAMGKSLDDECDVVETPTQDCLEYGEKLDELYSILKNTAPSSSQTLDVDNVHIPAVKGVPGKNSPAIKKALKAAQKATAEFGSTSPEARLAWETLEEISSSGLDNALGGALTDECLVEAAMEACVALEALQEALEKN